MGLFKSKEEKERERNMAIKKSMRDLEKHIVELEKGEKVFAEAVRIAQEQNLPQQIEKARQGLKESITEKKRTYMMLLDARMMVQRRDMMARQKTFLGAVKTITKSIFESMKGVNVSKIAAGFDEAIEGAMAQTEEFDGMIDQTLSSGDFSSNSYEVSDEEIDKILYGAGASAGTTSNIDDELAKLEAELGK
ncbi:MAG: hypothetical protein E7622_07475 [Ruminococcaceae bacterium]|nr:hypothetical protein [Oscillospiraceae bacterium]